MKSERYFLAEFECGAFWPASLLPQPNCYSN
jgi:hypothetical protein